MAEEIGNKLRQTAKKLESLRDTLELKLNLASKDTADAWILLKKPIGDHLNQLDKLAQKIESSSDEAKLQAYLGFYELRDKLEFFSGKMDHLIGEVNQQTSQMGEQLELTVLNAELSKLDAEEYLETKKAEFNSSFKESKQKAIAGIHSFIDRTSNRIDQLMKKLDN